MNTDTIADFLTKIQKCNSSKPKDCRNPASNIKKEITKVLHDKGFITNYKFEDNGPQGSIKIALKYNPRTNLSAIEKIVRVSKPGLESMLDSITCQG